MLTPGVLTLGVLTSPRECSSSGSCGSIRSHCLFTHFRAGHEGWEEFVGRCWGTHAMVLLGRSKDSFMELVLSFHLFCAVEGSNLGGKAYMLSLYSQSHLTSPENRTFEINIPHVMMNVHFNSRTFPLVRTLWFVCCCHWVTAQL